MKKTGLLVVFLLLKLGLCAQSKNNNSLLWEISGKGLKTPSYLFGTYHFAGKNIVDSLPIIRQKFEHCQAVAGEVIIDASAVQKMVPAMRLQNNTLDKIFTPAEYKQIDSMAMRLTGVGASAYNLLKPAALQLALLTVMAPKTISATNPQLDTWFQDEGRKRTDKIVGLESIDFQVDLLLNGSMDNQKKHLLAFVANAARYKEQCVQLYQYYQQQNMEGLNKLMYDNDEYDASEMDDLLKNRNLRWVAQLPGIISAQPTFIAVGAGHLVGQYGLINQLRLKGYTVKPVKI